MLLIVSLGLLSLLVVYLRFVYCYWSKRGVVHEPALPIVGNLLDVILMKRNASQVYNEIYKKHCNTHDAVGVYDFMTPSLLVLSPKLIKEVLTNFSCFHDNEFYVTEELDPYFYHDPFCLRGEAWKPMRTSFASLFTMSKVKEMFPYMKQLIPQLDNYLDQHQSKDLEAKELASLFMMNNTANSVFGVQCNCFSDPHADFRKMAELFVKEALEGYWQTLILFHFPRIRDFFRYRVIPKKVSDYLENMMQQLVEHRKKNNIKRNDAIANIMNKSGDDTFGIVALGVLIFVEGFETSSTVASFMLYELAINPGIQEQLRDELETASSDSHHIDFETLNKLPYLDKVLKETLRKYTLLYNLKKVCTKRCFLLIDGRTVEIEPDMPIIIPMYGVHNDPRYYPDPEVFDPERFANDKAEHSDTFYPFGNGPRICPGMRLANTQVKLFISNIVLKFRITPTKSTPSKISFGKNQLMQSEDPITIRFERRIIDS